GIVGFAGQIPMFAVAPLAGALIDRWRLHRVLVATQTLALVQALLLAGLTLARAIAVWHILLLSIVLGLVNAFDMPARQAFVVEMVENPQDLPNAIALNSLLVNAARLLGPSVAGVLIATVGEGWCFLLNGISYMAVIAALRAMTVRPRMSTVPVARLWFGLKEGLRYAFGFPPVRSVLLLLAVISLVGMPYSILMPVIATRVLHGGPGTLGLLMAASGLGAVTGAIWLAARRSVLGLGRVMVQSALVFGLGLVAFSFSRVLWLSLVLMAVSGFGLMRQLASSNTVLQTIVDDHLRGRVMSFYSMAFLGMAPFGSLLAGLSAGWIGAPRTLLLGGIACITGGLWFALRLPANRVLVRPIYIRKGVIVEPQPAAAAAAPLIQPPSVDHHG
ncbi:MAG TPA: MFS transporter, partial [Phycisphaerae bacterium]